MSNGAAYWFSREDGTTVHLEDPAEVGKVHTFEGVPKPRECGLHGSPTPWDALAYACGPILWIVMLGGEIAAHGDKCAAQSREYLFRLDLTGILRQFAAQCALSVLDKWDPPEVVREYIEGTARGEDKSAIRETACAAARDAACAAARAADYWACDAAWASAWACAAAWNAACAAARDAAWDEAWDAARWTAARDAARAAQREEFNGLVEVALSEAGWS